MIISFDSGEEQVMNQIIDLLGNEKFEVIEHKGEFITTSSNMKLYAREHSVKIKDKSLILGRRQFALLFLLAKSPNRIFTKEEIYAYVWNDAIPINVEETVRYHVSDIRRKLTELTGEKYIETVWGIGYRFCDMT